MTFTQRSPDPTIRPTYGFRMLPQDTVKKTLAGMDCDTNGRLLFRGTNGNPVYGGGIVSVMTSAGVAVGGASGNVEAVSAFATIPANMIGLGTILRVNWQAIATATVGTDTLQARLRLGPTTLTGTALLTGAAVDVVNNSFATGTFELTGRAAAGAAAAAVGVGQLSNFGTGATGVAPVPQMLGSTNFATNGALLLELTLVWSTTNANSARCDVFNVDIYNPA
jgi:hypothetical protein